MNIISAAAPRWADEAQTMIDLQIEVAGRGIIPFTASPADTEAHGRELFAMAAAGEFGAVAQKPPLTPEQLAKKAERDEIVSQRQIVKADAFVQQFVEMTPAQARARTRIATEGLPEPFREWADKMALMLLVMAKDQLA